MVDDRAALLLLDFQVGLGDQPWARVAVGNARAALAAARERDLLVVFSRVEFEPGYLDVSPSNKAFWPYRADDLLPPGASRLVEDLVPEAGEPVVVKNRFSPFAGGKLSSILRSQRITSVVLAGVNTSGVVLAAFIEGENHDLEMTVLDDACADPDDNLHRVLVGDLFPRSARVLPTAEWVGG